MPLMSGGDAVVRSLVAHGISTVYALPGVQSDHLFNAFFDAGDAIRVVHTRHEQGAAYMALGAALATAHSTGAKALALIGQVPSSGIATGSGYLHEISDPFGILRRLTKWAER